MNLNEVEAAGVPTQGRKRSLIKSEDITKLMNLSGYFGKTSLNDLSAYP